MKLIQQYLKEHSLSFPNKIAISDEVSSLTYRELENQTNLVTSSISKIAKKGDVIAVYVPYGKDIIVGALSVMKIGAIYLPLDASYPKERLSYMLSDSKAKAIVTLKDFYQKNPLDFSLEIIYMDDLKEEDPIKIPVLEENDPAFILYTSGTTGKPKGVLHSHTMMVSFSNWRDNLETKMNEKSNVAVMTGFTFIGTTDFMFSTIKCGGSLYFVKEEDKKDLSSLLNFLKEKKISDIFLPSSLAAIVVEMYDTSSFNIFAAGEKLRNFTPLNKKAKVFNAYGCTEVCGIFSTRINGNESPIPLGKLANDTKAILVDENLKEVKGDGIGELLVSNQRMSHSYLNLEKLNAEKWLSINGETYYRTGDRVRKDKNDFYYIVGRVDNMIKLRGFRIETGEVENEIEKAFQKLNFNVTALAVVLRNIQGNDHLCCYYESKQKIAESILKEEISKALADYMVPDFYMNLENMPRNPNGKISRDLLPSPKLADDEGSLNSDIEVKFAEILKESFHLSSINLDHSFLYYGGTSIEAMKVSSILKENGIDLTRGSLLTSSSLRATLSEAKIDYSYLWDEKEKKAIDESFKKKHENILKVLPLTLSQRQLSLEMALHPDIVKTQKVIVLQVDSLLSKDSLIDALESASKNNPTLRASLVYKESAIRQMVITDRKIPLKVINSESDNSILKTYESLSNKVIDIEDDPLFEVILLQKEKSLLYLYVHKFIYSRSLLRDSIKDIMKKLFSYYPNDKSIETWVDILSLDITEKNDEDTFDKSILITKKKEISDVFIYSDKPKTKMFFIHTGNSGSDAYYRLAKRIEDKISFYVIEPFNLYHQKEATYGIKNIAARYIETMKKYQPNGPYIIGGWCYGGVVAQEMAHQLEERGEKTKLLLMLDSHALTDSALQKDFVRANEKIDKEYFLTSPLFADIREAGMLKEMITNASHVFTDLKNNVPSFYDGEVLYFKPSQIPTGLLQSKRAYWEDILKLKAGGYENYFNKNKLEIIITPDEHDEMMNDRTLDIIVPTLYKKLGI